MAKRELDVTSGPRARKQLADQYDAQANSLDAMSNNVKSMAAGAANVPQPKNLAKGRSRLQSMAANEIEGAPRKVAFLGNLAATKRKYADTARKMNGGQ